MGDSLFDQSGANQIKRKKDWRCIIERKFSLRWALNRSFFPSTSSTTSVRADSSILLVEETQVMWSQHYARDTVLRCQLPGTCSKHSAVDNWQCNAMWSYWIRQARHTHSMKNRKTRENKQKQKQKQRRQSEREEEKNGGRKKKEKTTINININISGDHSEQDQILLLVVKIGKCVGLCVYRRSYLLPSPP